MNRNTILILLGSAAIGAALGFGIMLAAMSACGDTYQEIDPHPLPTPHITNQVTWGGNVNP